jgi:hypothetical protein
VEAQVLTIFHVGGGSDETGPIERVTKMFPHKLVTFEALEGQCIAGEVGTEVSFRLNTAPMSSGLFAPNPRYADESYTTGGARWGANTQLDRYIPMRTTTIDALAQEQCDVLSLDVQGAELAVMEGAKGQMANVLCVVSECEFAPIYYGQPLFHEQMRFLSRRGFRLMEFMNQQYWHQGDPFGLGFFTVAEAVWLRFDYEALTPAQTEKLAMVAAGFGRLSYALLLLARIDGKAENEWLRDLWVHRNNPEIREAACVR